jgi:hypothetical protein
LAGGEGRGERHEAGHGVGVAVGIDQTLAQHHEAAALAVDQRAAFGRGAEAVEKAAVAGEAAGMELGVAAGQEDGVGGFVGGLVGEGGEGEDLGAGGAPAVQQMGVGEGEGRVGGKGDALAERRQGRGGFAGRDRAGGAADGVEVDGVGDQRRGGGQEGVNVGVLGGLDEAEVALGQGEGGGARDGAEDAHVRRNRGRRAASPRGARSRRG